MTAAFRSSASDPFAALIGLPWVQGGQGPDGYDCWAFAGMVQRQFFGRALMPMGGFGPAELRPLLVARRAWRVTDTPRHGDMVELRKLGAANHVGVWLDIDRGGVLHCQQGAGVCFDRLDDIRLMGWRPRFWTPSEPVQPGDDAGGDAPRGCYSADLDGLMNPGADAGARLGAHMAVPVAAATGDSVADIVARAGLTNASIAVFVRRPGAAPNLDPASLVDADRLDQTLADHGLVPRADWAGRILGEGEVILIQALPQGGGAANRTRCRSSSASSCWWSPPW